MTILQIQIKTMNQGWIQGSNDMVIWSALGWSLTLYCHIRNSDQMNSWKTRVEDKMPNIFECYEVDVLGGRLGSKKWIQANFTWPKFSEVGKSLLQSLWIPKVSGTISRVFIWFEKMLNVFQDHWSWTNFRFKFFTSPNDLHGGTIRKDSEQKSKYKESIKYAARIKISEII